MLIAIDGPAKYLCGVGKRKLLLTHFRRDFKFLPQSPDVNQTRPEQSVAGQLPLWLRPMRGCWPPAWVCPSRHPSTALLAIGASSYFKDHCCQPWHQLPCLHAEPCQQCDTRAITSSSSSSFPRGAAMWQRALSHQSRLLGSL